MKCQKILLLISMLLLNIEAFSTVSNVYYRDFWQPKFNGIPLNYCNFGNRFCGHKVAKEYCHLMGYEYVKSFSRAYNVGLTEYIDSRIRCNDWRCSGFMFIRCSNKICHNPLPKYYYRYRQFLCPKLDNYRLDACYYFNKDCGRRAAKAFCRWKGYLSVKNYRIQNNVGTTKTLGDRALCLGARCSGFSYITCGR